MKSLGVGGRWWGGSSGGDDGSKFTRLRLRWGVQRAAMHLTMSFSFVVFNQHRHTRKKKAAGCFPVPQVTWTLLSDAWRSGADECRGGCVPLLPTDSLGGEKLSPCRWPPRLTLRAFLLHSLWVGPTRWALSFTPLCLCSFTRSSAPAL